MHAASSSCRAAPGLCIQQLRISACVWHCSPSVLSHSMVWLCSPRERLHFHSTGSLQNAQGATEAMGCHEALGALF